MTVSFRQPFTGDYPITLDYHEKFLPLYDNVKTFHKGIDYGCPEGTPILASADGIVIVVSYNPSGYGHYVIIRHENGYTSLYAHLKLATAKYNTDVSQGTVIGYSGNTGNSTGPHLHFEIHDDKHGVIDPKTVLHSVLDNYPNTYTPNTQTSEFEPVQSGFCVVVCDLANVRCHCDMSRVVGQRKKGDVIAIGDETTIYNGLPYRDYYDAEYKCWLRIAEHDPYTQIIRNTEI